jgi:hypothetical protein
MRSLKRETLLSISSLSHMLHEISVPSLAHACLLHVHTWERIVHIRQNRSLMSSQDCVSIPDPVPDKIPAVTMCS